MASADMLEHSPANVAKDNTPSRTTIPGTAPNRQMALMAEARAKATFDTETLAELIHDGPEALAFRRGAYARTEAAAGSTDSWKLPLQYAHTSREDLYREGLHTGRAAWEDGVKHDHSLFDVLTPRYCMSNASPFGIHFNLFGRSIDFLGNLEQRQKWMPLVAQGRVNGAYVQTEVGHGSNVAGIQTTATFDTTDDTIVLHTPTTSATKYWPGSVAFSATDAVVMARLIVPSQAPGRSKDYGVQPFLVALRDRETGRLASEGLELGDIGPMPGYNQNDNGYVCFNNVKIPRTNMLMGVCSLSRSGELTRLARAELVYGTMLSSRTFITHGAAFQLAQAVTIATRYSVVREQGNLPFEDQQKGSGEVPIMTYKSQQYRLLSQLANAHAMNSTAKITYAMQADLDSRLKKQDYSTVAHVHGLMAGAKAWFTNVAAEGAEDAKRCCGGHGYLSMSGLPEIVSTAAACCTLEGDNVVMWQQTARYLMKVMNVIEAGKVAEGMLPAELRYLMGFSSWRVLAENPKSLVDLHRSSAMRAYRHIKNAHGAMSDSIKRGLPKSQAWNTHMLLLIRAAHAHISYFVLDSFFTGLNHVKDTSAKRVLTELCHLFALTQLYPQTTSSASVLAYSTAQDYATIAAEEVDRLLDALTPNAIALTDAWDFSDASLASAIGCADGNVYERMMSWTRQLPINVNAKKPGGFGTAESWARYMKPALNLDLGEKRETKADARFGQGGRARL